MLEGPLLAVGIVSDNRHVYCGLASMGLIFMLGMMVGNVDDSLGQQVHQIRIQDPSKPIWGL